MEVIAAVKALHQPPYFFSISLLVCWYLRAPSQDLRSGHCSRQANTVDEAGVGAKEVKHRIQVIGRKARAWRN